jgi:predicted TIM-barrel fold metal-dependent hydrolase
MAYIDDSPFGKKVSKLVWGSEEGNHIVDLSLYYEHLVDFLPETIVDAHVHMWKPDSLKEPIAPERHSDTMLEVVDGFTAQDLHYVYENLLPEKRVRAVCFGLAAFEADACNVNALVASQTQNVAARLLIPPPGASSDELKQAARKGGFAGLKPYPERAEKWAGARNEVEIEDFVTEAQWQAAHECGLVILLHLPRTGGIGDPVNAEALDRLLGHYAGARVILAHLGLAPSAEELSTRLQQLRHHRNLFVDTALVCDGESVAIALETMGPSRVLFGTDLPFALVRGRRVYREGRKQLLTWESYRFGLATGERYSHLMYESLKAIKEAALEVRLTKSEVSAIFNDNARAAFGAA